MAKRADITAAQLRAILHYNPETGTWTWRHRADVGKNWNTKYAFKAAGRINTFGYRELIINKRFYRSCRLAFLYVEGRWPEYDIDHIDTDRKNDRFSNLREATRSQNNANKRYIMNKVGLKGVRKISRTGWSSSIKKDREHIYLGTFRSPEEAHEAYMRAARLHFGEFARAG